MECSDNSIVENSLLRVSPVFFMALFLIIMTRSTRFPRDGRLESERFQKKTNLTVALQYIQHSVIAKYCWTLSIVCRSIAPEPNEQRRRKPSWKKLSFQLVTEQSNRLLTQLKLNPCQVMTAPSFPSLIMVRALGHWTTNASTVPSDDEAGEIDDPQVEFPPADDAAIVRSYTDRSHATQNPSSCAWPLA